MTGNLDFLFEPRSVAVIGASKDPEKWGYLMSESLIESGYKGDIYLINVKGGVVCGRETYRSISDIESPVDLAVIGIPARFVPDAIRECVEKGVKAVIIVSAHFSEYSEEGKEIEKEMVEMAHRGGTRIVGPNCLGVYNSSIDLNTILATFPRGHFAFLTQSGNCGLEVNYFAKKRGLGFSKFVSLGNQIDILFHEYLDYIKDDPDTRVILLYMEGLKDGREFLRIAKETTKSKPMIAIKVGTSSAGARSAMSHTGSLAGSNEVYAASFKQAGIVRVQNSDELLDVGEILAKCPIPKGNKIAILANGGGTATMAADAAERYNLKVPVLSKETQEKVKEVIAAAALHSSKNPIDFADDADIWAWERFPEILLQDKEIDGLVMVGGYGGYTDIWPAWKPIWEEMAYKISELPQKYNKPLIVHSMFHGDKPKSLETFSSEGIPVYGNVERAMKCMGVLADYGAYVREVRKEEREKVISLPEDRTGRVKSIIRSVKVTGRVSLVETEAREILKAYGLPISNFKLAKTVEEAIGIAKEIGYPVAMKIVSPDIIHKTDAGGVKLNIQHKGDVASAFTEIVANARDYNKDAEIYGVIITPMERKGVETIVGMTTDETFGPTIMFGLGGIFVEVLKDVSFRVAPLTRRDAYDMIQQIKGFPILKGVRGAKAADIDALVDVIMKVSALVIENPEIKELDLNPVFAFENGASIVDARIILR